MASDKPTGPSRENRDSGSKREIITPLRVHRRTSDGHPSRPGRPAIITVLLMITVMAVIVTGGFILIRHVSKHPVDLTKEAEQATRPDMDVPGKLGKEKERKQLQTIETGETIDLSKGVREKETAEEKMAEFLKLKNDIDEMGAAEWGGAIYVEMTTLGSEADTLLMDGSFQSASEKYTEAGRRAARLADDAGSVFQRLIMEGQKAFEEGDSAAAIERYRKALLIEPSNDGVRRKLARAENLDRVTNLIESGKKHEKENSPAFALADYREALKLDPESREAQEAMREVKERIAGDQFQILMSQGLADYHKGNYQRARTRLLKAQSFRSNSEEAKNALIQVDEAIRLDTIEKLRQKGMIAEQTEDWQQALKVYMDVLSIDGAIRFAIEGKERSLKHLRIGKRITFFLNNPGALESNEQLQNAILVTEEADMLQPGGPRFKAQLDELKALVTIARTPLTVIIDSDNLTDVAVYKVGKLGRFTSRELSLRPGTYTVVGSRDGYKDVRHKIIVKPAKTALRVTVICRNKV